MPPIEKRLVLVGLLVTAGCAHSFAPSYASPAGMVAPESESAPADFSRDEMPMEADAPASAQHLRWSSVAGRSWLVRFANCDPLQPIATHCDPLFIHIIL